MATWWQKSGEAIAVSLNSSTQTGLTTAVAQAHLIKFGPNSLKEKKGRAPLAIFLDQFREFIVWILIAAALVSGFLQAWVDALAILAIILLNAILGFFQEYGAEKSLAALKKLSSPSAKVIRDGHLEIIPAGFLVPGDLVELEAGDNVPADGRLTYLTPNFSTVEAALTGESTPSQKTAQPLAENNLALIDRANLVFMGTAVAAGKARAIIVETGMLSELGKIAGMLQQEGRETTPLQKKLEEFGKFIVYVCFILVGLVFLFEFLQGGNILDVFLTAVSLAVAAIPEGLPAVVTMALALGVKRMVSRHVLIRKLPSVETLGCATVICSDKTGTLTKNEMTVTHIFDGKHLIKVTGIGYQPVGQFLSGNTIVTTGQLPALAQILHCGVLCNGAELIQDKENYKIAGDPTEAALLVCAAKANLWKEKLEAQFPFEEEIPFDSTRKKMTVVRKISGPGTTGTSYIAFVKGAPDILLKNCSTIDEGGTPRPMLAPDLQNIAQTNANLSNQALRVLAIAYRQFDSLPENLSAENIEKDLIFAGLVAMIDPPREEAKTAVEKCRQAQIKTVMITGDHKNTAVAIAREIGIFKDGALAKTGEELDQITDAELSQIVGKTAVYARVSPEHKYRIVKALRSLGETVAMTGDGVNDAPAVKEADIGIAMGITGTDVTKDVSDMVITDDNFASIVAAVEEGRGIYDNIKKFIHYLLSCNAGEILVMFIASLVGLPPPLLPIHILWVNLVTDGLPALALGMDPHDKNVMRYPPRKRNEPIINRQNGLVMLMQGGFIAFCSLAAFYYVLNIEKGTLTNARSAAFVVLAVSQLFHALNCRSQTVSIFKLGIFTNRWLIGAILGSFILQALVIYWAPLQIIFKTIPFSPFDLMLVIILSSLPLWAMEAVKSRLRQIS
ncbi:MAG: calcium-translocating P-type ATPase, SERCA-type [Candidatus Margulisiibacteriota bacterium]